jgi:acyl-coenzyme A thioesterase PaaI-like protein
MPDNYVLKLRDRCWRLPYGKRIFSSLVARRAPYFKTISPLITDLAPGRCEVLVAKTRAVQNHIGTVHVIAIVNGLEMAMGVMAEASIPAGLRWIPKGMTVDYTAKAGSDIRCIAELEPEAWAPGDVDVRVVAMGAGEEPVVRGTIRLWITKKQSPGQQTGKPG